MGVSNPCSNQHLIGFLEGEANTYQPRQPLFLKLPQREHFKA